MESGTVQFAVDASITLTGELDVDALVEAIPEAYVLRGMFFTALVADLGEEFEALAPKLCSPPPGGKYLALTNYPVRDHVRVIDAAARRVYPGRSNREAQRLRGQSALDAFKRSLLGKTMVSIIEDPATMLLRVPDLLFSRFIRGPTGRASREGSEAVKIELLGYFGGVEYMAGVFEGIVMSFGQRPRVEVQGLSPSHWIFLVTWS